MITIHIMGGLGNQLFQVFHLINYCLSNQIPFYFEYQEQSRSDRPFYWNNFLKSLQPFVKYAKNNLLYKEDTFHYVAAKPYSLINRDFKFVGYYQSYKYFQDNVEKIYNLIKLREQKQEMNTKYNSVYNFGITLSMHFRLGDYKNVGPQCHPIMNIEYYEKALNKILDLTGKNTYNVLYFFEKEDNAEIEKIINQLVIKFNTLTFIPINTDIVDYEQMLLMSLCQHNIIANSTFSWWGAYFNDNKEKVVIHPSLTNWFGQQFRNKVMKDLCPKSWIEI